MTLQDLRLRSLPAPWRQLAAWTLVVLAVGYAHGLAFIVDTTQASPPGIEQRFRGSDPQTAPDPATQELHFAKSRGEMFAIIHTHMLGMTAMFAVSGLIFSFCSLVRGAWKRFLLIEPFAAILVTFAAMWLTWGVHPLFAWVMLASGISLALVFYSTVALALWELLVTARRAR